MEPHDQALCPANLNPEEPRHVTYLKNLCCENCAIEDPPEKDLTNILLASIIPGPVVILAVISAYFLMKRRAARTSIRETKEGKNKAPVYVYWFQNYMVVHRSA